MKVDRMETHDRFEHFTNQSFDIGATCQKIMDERPFAVGFDRLNISKDHPFYVFSHKREMGLDERVSRFNQDLMQPVRRFKSLEEIPNARIIWQPRLTKPFAQENSMLFKVYPGTDLVNVIWMIPDRTLWDQFTKGKMTENQIVVESIHAFQNDKAKLEAKEDDDLSEEQVSKTYDFISKHARNETFDKI